jgi:hypothetical protein
MNPPPRLDLPFFAYGLFRPGQLAFSSLRPWINEISEPVEAPFELRLRDGLPLINKDSPGRVVGSLLRFSAGSGPEAYAAIAQIEPDKQYIWGETIVRGELANVLFGRSPERGSASCEELEWNGWNDPLFTIALDVVQETIDLEEHESNGSGSILKSLFRLQMAYMLLWSSIERYCSLRYRRNDTALKRRQAMAQERAFALALQTCVTRGRKIFRADDPQEACVLTIEKPEKAIEYYYQVRCNVTHTGKASIGDLNHVLPSAKELVTIFRQVLRSAADESRFVR